MTMRTVSPRDPLGGSVWARFLRAENRWNPREESDVGFGAKDGVRIVGDIG